MSKLTDLSVLSEENILSALQQYHQDGQLCHSFGRVALKLNPYPNYSNDKELELLSDYLMHGKPSADNKPYGLYLFAEELKKSAILEAPNQFAIAKGTCGSGKSENIKLLIQYLVASESNNLTHVDLARDLSKPLGSNQNAFWVPSDTTNVSKKLIASILLLETFTSEITDRNLYASKVIKHIKVKYNSSGKIIGHRITPLFTEILRSSLKDTVNGPLIIQSLFIHGAQKSLLDQYLIPGALKDSVPMLPGYDSVNEYNFLKDTICSFGGIDLKDWDQAMKVVSAIVNLQGVTLLGAETTIISSSTKGYVSNAEQLLNLENGYLFTAILKKPDDRIGRPAGSLIECKPLESRVVMDCLISELLKRLLHYFLEKLSVNLEDTLEECKQPGVINMLDCIGWEKLSPTQVTSMNTLMYHYFEERMNELYNIKAFKDELVRYELESIQLDMLPLPDPTVYIDFFDKVPGGILQMLEETCQAPRGEDKVYSDKVIMTYSKLKQVKAGGSKSKPTVFVVKHSFTETSYDSEGFIYWNKLGNLPGNVLTTLGTSGITYIAENSIAPIGADNTESTGKSKATKANSPSSFSWFKRKQTFQQIVDLIESSTKVSYILSFNLQLYSKASDPTISLVDYLPSQIQSLNLPSLISFHQQGYNYVRSYLEFYSTYRILVPFDVLGLPIAIIETNQSNIQVYVQRLTFECFKTYFPSFANITQLSQIPKSDIVFGKTVIFIKENIIQQLESFRQNRFESFTRSSVMIQKHIRKFKAWKTYKHLLSTILTIQSSYRMSAQRKRFKHQIHCIIKIQNFLLTRYLSREFQALKRAVDIIKSKVLGRLMYRIRYQRLKRSVHSLQHIARGFILRRSSVNVYQAMRLLQRMGKIFVQRRRKIKMESRAISMIQKIFRGFLIRKKYSNLVQILAIRREQRIAVLVVKKLQAMWRQKLIIGRYKEVEKATIVLQRWFRMQFHKQRFSKILYLTKILQAHTRKLMAQKLTNSLKVSSMVKLEKSILSQLFYQETAFLHSISMSDCYLSNGYNRKMTGRCKTFILAYDIAFDLSYAYPQSWLSTILQFKDQLQRNGNHSIVQIVLGNQHTLILDDQSNVYSMGLGDLGQLGQNNRISYPTPKLIESLRTLLSGDAAKSAAQSKTGSNPSAIKAAAQTKAITHTKPTSIIAPKMKILELACGREHSLLLTCYGTIFSWGENKRGQLGHSNFDASSMPRLITGPDQKVLQNVVKIGTGDYFSACLVDPGVLYTWGSGENLGQELSPESIGKFKKTSSSQSPVPMSKMTLTNEYFHRPNEYAPAYYKYDSNREIVDSCIPEPLAIGALLGKKKIRYFVCGESHIVALVGNEFYSWGSNQYGQLGNGNTQSSQLPNRVMIHPFNDLDIPSLVLLTGGRHNCILSKGNIWLWGWNKYGQIGDGKIDNVLKPIQIAINKSSQDGTKPLNSSIHNSKRHLKPSEKEIIKSASLGWRSTIVLTQTRHLYGWGVINPVCLSTNDTLSKPWLEETSSDNLMVSEPFTIFLNPELMVFSAAQNKALEGQFNKLSVSNCSTLSLVSLEVDLKEEQPLKPSSDIDISEIQNTSSKTTKLAYSQRPSTESKLNESMNNISMNSMQMTSSVRLNSTKSDFTTIPSKSDRPTKSIHFTAPADEVLERFRKDVGRLQMNPRKETNKDSLNDFSIKDEKSVMSASKGQTSPATTISNGISRRASMNQPLSSSKSLKLNLSDNALFDLFSPKLKSSSKDIQQTSNGLTLSQIDKDPNAISPNKKLFIDPAEAILTFSPSRSTSGVGAPRSDHLFPESTSKKGKTPTKSHQETIKSPNPPFNSTPGVSPEKILKGGSISAHKASSIINSPALGTTSTQSSSASKPSKRESKIYVNNTTALMFGEHSSFKEQMEELGYLRKKNNPRGKFSDPVAYIGGGGNQQPNPISQFTTDSYHPTNAMKHPPPEQLNTSIEKLKKELKFLQENNII